MEHYGLGITIVKLVDVMDRQKGKGGTRPLRKRLSVPPAESGNYALSRF
jgi:hypothetical protein